MGRLFCRRSPEPDDVDEESLPPEQLLERLLRRGDQPRYQAMCCYLAELTIGEDPGKSLAFMERLAPALKSRAGKGLYVWPTDWSREFRHQYRSEADLSPPPRPLSEDEAATEIMKDAVLMIESFKNDRIRQRLTEPVNQRSLPQDLWKRFEGIESLLQAPFGPCKRCGRPLGEPGTEFNKGSGICYSCWGN